MSDWRAAVKNAKHYKALGQERVHLSRDADAPWHLVTEIEQGSTFRYEMPVSLYFKAKHPCGLSFEWGYDLEPREANGHGEFQIDIKRLREIIAKLPSAQAAALTKLLAIQANGLEGRGKEYQEAATRQFGQANALRSLL